MRKAFIIILFLLNLLNSAFSQEKYGKTINFGVGATYYRYVGRSVPALSLNYEIDVAKNFTLAPTVSYFTYRNYYGWYGPGPGPVPGPPKNKNYYYYYYPGYRFYYRETVVPIGLKGTYYFDELLNANKKWDFYLAATLGFAIRTFKWEEEYYYYPDRDGRYDRRSSVYGDIHIGTEYHLSTAIGLFADISLGMATIGLAIHHK